MFKIVLIDSNLFFYSISWKSEFALRICWNKTGFPVQDIRKTNCFWRISKPASRLRKPASRIHGCCSRVHIRSTGSQIRQTVFGSSRFCPITGQPVRKSGKPDSWALVLLLLPLSWVFCTCSSSLSQNREPPSSISNQFLFISQPFLCQDQSLKPLPMHFIFITHFSIMISSLIFHHFIIISHEWTLLPVSLSTFSSFL